VVSVIELILNGIGIGWTYVLLGGFSVLALPLIYAAMVIGPQCRKKRAREEELARVAL
jgi:hypothetical protein